MTIKLQNINNITEQNLEQQKPFIKLRFLNNNYFIIQDTLDNLIILQDLLELAQFWQEFTEENIFAEDLDSLNEDLNEFLQKNRFLGCIDFRTLNSLNLIQ